MGLGLVLWIVRDVAVVGGGERRRRRMVVGRGKGRVCRGCMSVWFLGGFCMDVYVCMYVCIAG